MFDETAVKAAKAAAMFPTADEETARRLLDLYEVGQDIVGGMVRHMFEQVKEKNVAQVNPSEFVAAVMSGIWFGVILALDHRDVATLMREHAGFDAEMQEALVTRAQEFVFNLDEEELSTDKPIH